ncbi:MAG TPA: TolC family protein [Thermoanaerobaculia bacterium]|nr:TolC family protein [Thermoanaerobaculia bacterium]
MKSSLVAGLLIGCLARTGSGQESRKPEGAGRARLREYLSIALAQNPALTSMEARIDAARRRVEQSTALPDPEVELGIKDIPPFDPSLSRSDFTMEMVTARQRFPGLGKRDALRRAASEEVSDLVAQHERHVAMIGADVGDAFFQIAALDRRLEILRRTKARLSDAATSASERYRVGKVSQADVLRANLETTGVEEQLLMLDAERRAAAARLNATMALSASTPVAPIPAFDPAGVKPGIERLVDDALARSPSVASAEAQVRKAEVDLEQARLERHPDLMLMAYYGHRTRFEDLAGASIAFNLPFTHPRRLDQKRAEMDAMLTAARANLSSTRNDLQAEIEAAQAELEKNLAQLRLHRGSILPQAEINYRSAREAYTVGQIDFLTFVKAATDLSMYESEEAIRAAGAGRAIAALQKASGLRLLDSMAAEESR